MRLRSGFEYVPICIPQCARLCPNARRRSSFRRKVNARLRIGNKAIRPGLFQPLVGTYTSVKVEKVQQVPKSRVSKVGLSTLRRWARESLSRRFRQGENPVVPSQDAVAGLRYPCRRLPPEQSVEKSSRARVKTKFDLLVGDPKVKKKFLKITRGVFSELGITLVGPVPFRALEIMWVHFGEEHFAPHGRTCWCRLCRSVGPARFNFLAQLGDMVVDYLVKMPLYAIKSWVLPLPLRAAEFVANKLWKWLKILFQD